MNLTDLAVAQRLREGTYTAGKGRRVYFQDESTVRDVADLYAILKEEDENGSPNLENELVRGWIEHVQTGSLLNNQQLAKLLEMVKRYKPQIDAYRASSDRSRDILNVPEDGRARIL